AMTGEITLRGKVTAIGGLKEKLLAALRGGIRTVVIPEENRKDLADIPANVTDGMEIVPVKWIDEVLDLALERPLAPAAAKAAVGGGGRGAGGGRDQAESGPAEKLGGPPRPLAPARGKGMKGPPWLFFGRAAQGRPLYKGRTRHWPGQSAEPDLPAR